MKTYIWTFPTRLFHWLLAVSSTVAYLLGGEEEHLGLHAAFGSFIGALVLFRILQGFIGPKYARFSDFPVSPSSLWIFLTDMKKSKAAHPGHNPMASVIILCIMITALLSAISGMLVFASGDTGFLGFRIMMRGDPEVFVEIHEIVVKLFLILVAVHLTGILADTLFHSENRTVLSIFTGYKRLRAEEASQSGFHKIFSVFWFAIPVLLFFYVLRYQPLPTLEKEKTEHVDETNEDND